MGGTPFCEENSFIDTARDVGSQGSGCKPMLADVMNRKWRVGLLKKTPTEGEGSCGVIARGRGFFRRQREGLSLRVWRARTLKRAFPADFEVTS